MPQVHSLPMPAAVPRSLICGLLPSEVLSTRRQWELGMTKLGPFPLSKNGYANHHKNIQISKPICLQVTWRLGKPTTEFTKNLRGSRKTNTLFHTLPAFWKPWAIPESFLTAWSPSSPHPQFTNLTLTPLHSFPYSSPSLPWSPSSQVLATVKQDACSHH